MSKDNTDYREELKKQILVIRDSGLVNMLDKNAVQRLASERGYSELVCFTEDHPGGYSEFIISGDPEYLSR